jgi:hypothetical protein
MPNYYILPDPPASQLDGIRISPRKQDVALFDVNGLRVGDTESAIGDVDVVNAGNVVELYMAAGVDDNTVRIWRLTDSTGLFELVDESSVVLARFTSLGHLGIGATPGSTRPIQTANAASISIWQNQSTATNSRVGFAMLNDAQTYQLLVETSDIFVLKDVTNSNATPFCVEPGVPSDTLYLDSPGNVGVGTATPSDKLQVDGNVQINDDLFVSGGRLRMDGANGDLVARVEDNGRVNVYWNSDGSGSPTFINGGEDAARVFFDGNSFAYYRDEGSGASPGDAITWDEVFEATVGDVTHNGSVSLLNHTGNADTSTPIASLPFGAWNSVFASNLVVPSDGRYVVDGYLELAGTGYDMDVRLYVVSTATRITQGTGHKTANNGVNSTSVALAKIVDLLSGDTVNLQGFVAALNRTITSANLSLTKVQE